MNRYLIEYYEKGRNITTVAYIRAVSKDEALKKFIKLSNGKGKLIVDITFLCTVTEYDNRNEE